MKKNILYILTTLFTLGSLFSIILILKFDKENLRPVSLGTHADWPEMTMEEMTDEADIIALVKVEDQEMKNERIDKNFDIERKFSNLQVKKVIKGEVDEEIILNQALNYVDENGKYLIFLRQGEDGLYYEVTDESIVPYENGKYESNIQNYTNEYKEGEIVELIEEVMEENQEKNQEKTTGDL